MAECLGLAEGTSRVDLHGLSVGEARAAVLCCLASVQQRAAAGQALDSDLKFITGMQPTERRMSQQPAAHGVSGRFTAEKDVTANPALAHGISQC